MKKYLLGFFAVVFAVAFSAFSTRVVDYYHFTGENVEELKDPSMWESGISPRTDCNLGAGLPCTVEIKSTSSIADLNDFQAFILAVQPESVDALREQEDDIENVEERPE